MDGTTMQEWIDRIRDDYESTQSQLREIDLLLEQSRGEVEKLAQRNASISGRLRLLQQSFDTAPRNDIRGTYDAALESQQRLFTMRGQVEKLQGDQGHLKRHADHLQKVLEALGGLAPGSLTPGGAASGGGQSAGADVVIRIIDAQEVERQRMSRAMHDGPAQSLTNFVLQAEIVQRLFDSNPEQARAELKNLKSTATTTFQRVRDFITELRPMMLDDLGLVPTIRRYVRAFEEKSGITTQLTVTGDERRFESHREVLAFRAVQELLNNARTHAQCTQVKVTVDVDEAQMRGAVEDNGKGFDVESALAPGQKHIGLSTLKEKVELLGGHLEIGSTSGQGTRATVELPVGNGNAN
ncbi:MAG: sensor histidine kinase [Chloroflexi bacterium]|nr:sensor histidine kinase [Chloroflexota bacterium]